MEIKPAMVAIAAFVVITVIAAVLMPVLTDATKTTDTFTNNGAIRYTEVDDTESYTMSWDKTTFDKVTVNGEDYTVWRSDIGIYNISLIMVPNVGILRYNTTSSGFNSNQVVGLGNLSVGVAFTATFEEGTYTITNDQSASITGSYTKAYIPDPNGEYILKKSADKAYMSSGSTIIADSDMVAMGVTTVTAWNNGFQVVGTLSDYTVSVFNPAVNTFVISDVTDDKTSVSGYNNLYTISKIMFNVTDSSDSTVDVDATYSYFLVPYEVTAERTVHLDPNESAILLVIPALLIIAILVGVLAVAMRGRE